MLVTRILGDCPGCGRRASFGNVNVFGDQLVRGCGCCDYSARIPLPPIRRKIVYLDQFFFSHAFRGRETRFIHAANRIKVIAGKQLLAAPYSSIHENETLLYAGRDELEEFIKDASRGVKFSPSYRVERTQVVRAFRAWLVGEPVEYVLHERDAIDGKLHQWDGYFRIDIGRVRNDPNDLRRR